MYNISKIEIMSIFDQLVKFGLIGICINLLVYLIYIFLANVLAIYPPISAILAGMSVTPIGFQLNKKYIFESANGRTSLVFKYYILYMFTILMNGVNIWIFSTILGFPHEIVAGISIVVLAFSSFLIQKFCIFSKS